MRYKRLLSYTEKSPEDLFIGIVSGKNKPCKQILFDEKSILCIKPHIINRFHEYKKNRKGLEKLTPFPYTEQQKSCLEGCYDSDTDAKKKLIALIKGKLDTHSKAVCSYCGIGRPTTIDHYLPKSIFPEFSVLSYNLIPCCPECNNLKSNHWIDDKSKTRLFVNFYFDEIPNENYLFAKILPKNNAFLVEFFYKAPNNSKIFSTISTHLTKLDITNRLEVIANSHIDTVYDQNQSALYAGSDAEQLKNTLRLNTRILEKKHGKNYWQVVLNRAIQNSNSFFTLQ